MGTSYDELYYAAESRARDELVLVGFDFGSEQTEAQDRILHLVTIGLLEE